MALSDWDTMLFDWEGKPCASIKTKKGTVAIYKNWIQIFSGEEQIARIVSGDLGILDLTLKIARHDDQAAVFILGTHWSGPEKGNQAFCGVGCYGYMSDEDWLKLKHPAEYEKYREDFEVAEHINSYSSFGGGNPDDWGLDLWMGETHKKISLVHLAPKHPYEEQWTGVKPEIAQALFDWVKVELDDEKLLPWLEQCKSNPLRFNQGDLFFAAHTGCEMEVTSPGESQGTILQGLLAGGLSGGQKDGSMG